jgi:flavin-dependent dehydrogenase
MIRNGNRTKRKKEKMGKYDIIIAGAGPAGLTAAVELSKKFKILVIERRKPGTTSCTWYSYADRVKKYDIEDAVVARFDRIRFTSPTQEHDMMDDAVTLDHNKVLQMWLERAQANGAVIRQETFRDYEYKNDGVVVKTSGGEYYARLLIDAMGSGSPILAKHNLIKRHDAWVIWGGVIEHEKHEKPYVLEYYPLNDEDNTYVGIHPHSDTITNIYVFQGKSNTMGNPAELKDIFEKTIKKLEPNGKIIQNLGGTIVSGSLKKYALDKIIFFGASGMLNPDGCGMGFNEILKQYQTFAKGITEAMEKNTLDQKTLSKIADSLRDQETMNFQKIIGAFSLYFIKSEGKWDGGVKWLNAMGKDSKYWMRNEFTMDWIMRANLRLHKVIPIKETISMIPMDNLAFVLEQLARFSVKAATSVVKNKMKKEVS